MPTDEEMRHIIEGNEASVKLLKEAKAAADALKPLGTNPKDLIGIKKVRLSLVPPSSIVYQALAMEDGAKKYGPYNWRLNKVQASIYVDAAMRHLTSWFDGEDNAEDSQKPHLAHALACLGILVDAKETGNLVDDRPKAGSTSALIERFKKS